MKIKEILFALLRCEISETALSNEIKQAITPEVLHTVYKLACRHDLGHLVIDALSKNDLLPADEEERYSLLETCQFAVYRYETMSYELKQICQTLENAHIDHIPLKGSVIREYYPEPWMRTSCDIDILVREEDLEKAAEIITETLGYTNEGKNYHDISLRSPVGVHLELHFSIKENMENIDALLEKVWEYAAPRYETKHHFVLQNEYLLFHILAHTSYHFLSGGCGIRPLLDLWILKHRYPYEREKVEKMCETCGILTFYQTIDRLLDVWFSNADGDELTQDVENYILKGGVYGAAKSRIAVQQVKKGGKGRYIFSRIFMPYRLLKTQFPVLEKHKWLTPFCHIRRWCRVLFKGKLKKSINEWSVSASITDEKQQATANLIQRLGL